MIVTVCRITTVSRSYTPINGHHQRNGHERGPVRRTTRHKATTTPARPVPLSAWSGRRAPKALASARPAPPAPPAPSAPPPGGPAPSHCPPGQAEGRQRRWPPPAPHHPHRPPRAHHAPAPPPRPTVRLVRQKVPRAPGSGRPAARRPAATPAPSAGRSGRRQARPVRPAQVPGRFLPGEGRSGLSGRVAGVVLGQGRRGGPGAGDVAKLGELELRLHGVGARRAVQH
jgi:translation initiation factor IF-2